MQNLKNEFIFYNFMDFFQLSEQTFIAGKLEH